MSANSNPAPMNANFPESIKRFDRKPEDRLADEVAALRAEIAALRLELTPKGSILLAGKEAVDEFCRLVRKS